MAGASYDRYNAYVALPQIESNVKDVKAEVKKVTKELVSSCPFPVNSVLMFDDETDPNDIWTGTNWETIGSDCYLIGQSASKTAGSTGGSNTVSLTTDNLPKHSHTTPSHGHGFTQPTVNGGGDTGTAKSISGGSHTHTAQGTTHKFMTGGSTDRYHLAASGTLSGFILTTGSDHTHALPSHTHSVSGGAVESGGAGTSGETGSSSASISIQPSYYSVAIWKRTE